MPQILELLQPMRWSTIRIPTEQPCGQQQKMQPKLLWIFPDQHWNWQISAHRVEIKPLLQKITGRLQGMQLLLQMVNSSLQECLTSLWEQGTEQTRLTVLTDMTASMEEMAPCREWLTNMKWRMEATSLTIIR